MALITCPECKAEVSSQAPSCPRCGYPIAASATPDLVNQKPPGDNLATPVTSIVPNRASASSNSAEEFTYEAGCTGGLIVIVGIATIIAGVYMMNWLDRWDLQTSRSQIVNEAGYLVLAGGIILSLVGIAMTGEANSKIKAEKDSQIICPHCQVRGNVRTYRVTRKKGISGTKATAALLTGGISILGTGLSRKETETKARCSNCGAEWYL